MSFGINPKYLTIVYSLSTFVFFILIIISYVKLSGSDHHYMHNLGLNWNRGPINSIQPSGFQCTENLEPIISNFWPGTKEGCYCSINTSLFYGPLRPGRCYKKRDNLLFCSTVREVPRIRWQNWRGKYICGKRVESSYLDLSISKRPESCPMNMKSCGIIDSLNNVLCVRENEACPINSIQIDTTNNPIPKDSMVINADGANIIFSNTNIKGNILNELYIGDDQPCADPEYANYNFKPYLLDKFYDKSKCNSKLGKFVYDESYHKIDKSNSINLLKDNGILNVLNTLPLYNPTENNHEMNLYQRSYVGLNPDCLADLNRNGINNSKRILNNLKEIDNKVGWALSLNLICLVLGCVLFILMIFYSCMVSLINSDNEIKNIAAFMIIANLFEISIIIMGFYIVEYLNSYSQDNEIFERQECLDEITFAASGNFYPSVSSVITLTKMNLILMFLSFFSKILQILIFCKGGSGRRVGYNDMPEATTEIVAPQNQNN